MGDQGDQDQEMPIQEPDNKKKEDIIKGKKQYYKSNIGPFFVYARPLEKNKKFDSIKINKYIFNKYKNITVTPVNTRKLKITAQNAEVANNLIADVTLFELCDVYVPLTKIETQGYATLTYDIADLKEICSAGYGKCDKLPTEINLINAESCYNKAADGTLTPNNNVLLTFEGNILPDYLIIYGLRIKIRPKRIKMFNCDNCLRIGHSSKFCYSKAKCSGCGGDHNEKECPGSTSKSTAIELCKICKKDIKLKAHETCKKVIYASNRATQKQLLNQKLSYANVLASLAEQSDADVPTTNELQEDSSTFPTLNNRAKGKRVSSFEDLTNLRPMKQIRTNTGPKNSTPIKTKAAPTTQAPGFRRSETDDCVESIFKKPVIEFCLECGLPQIIIDLIVKFLLPLVDKFWTRINESITRLLCPLNNHE